MSFQLQIWAEGETGGRYYRSLVRESVEEVRAEVPNGNFSAYRIVDTEREKELPLKPKFRKRSIRRSTLDSIDIKEQAKRAAEHLLARGPGDVPVFPCGGTGHSNDFRYFLALYILQEPSRTWGDDWNMRRRRNEEKCAEAGYPFVEVDPEDFR